MTGSENSDTRENPVAPGVALRAARTAQNLSVGEVARQLRLSVAQIEALEASAFERLPGQVFVRGFIRNYARLLKLDPDALLRDLAPAYAPEQEPRISNVAQAEPLTVRARRWPWYAVAVTMLIAALAIYEFLIDDPSQPAPAKAMSRGTISAPVAAPPVDAPPPASPVVARPEDAAPGTEPGAQSATPVEAPAPASARDSTEGSAGTTPAESEVVMTFDRDSWVEIRDASGRTIFSQLNRGGSEQRVRGRPPLVVIVGNAHGVRLTYNDRAVDLAPHMKYDVARLTLE